MTGYAKGGDPGEQLSVMTLGMLEDIGYAVDYARSDAYQMTASSRAPVIISDGGGTTTQIGVLDGYRTVTSVHAIDGDLTDRVTYQIYNGPDQGQFRIDPISGFLELIEPADASTPRDANGDGIWEVTVRATDGYRYDLQSIEVGLALEVETEGDVGLYKGPGSYGLYDFRTNGEEFALTDSRGRYFDHLRYTFLHAEENPSGGYQVLEQVVGRRGDIGYAVRHFNDAGEQTGSTSLGASVPDLVTWETTFEADLNGDDRIGHSYNGVEDSDSGSSGAQAYGDHQIHTSTSGGFAITTAGFDQDDPQGEVPVGLSQVDRRGNALTISNANYTFLHAEENPSGGYQVLEQVVGRRGDIGYAVRHFNDAGEQTGSTSLGASVPDLVTWETTFEADLNGDDRIGHSYNGVEDSDSGSSGAQAYGDHQIHTSTSGGFAITTAGFDQDDPQGEVPVGLSQVDRRGNALTISNANYTFLHAEENPSGGYQVLEQVVGRRGDIGYAVRHFNDAGEQTGSTSLGASVPDLVTWETTFEADLNGDDRIGHSYNGVEDSDSGSSGAQAYGDHQIHTSTSGGFAITTAGFDQDDPQGEVPVGLSQVDRRGNALTISNANYTFLHAEENPSGGYQVLEQVVGRRGDIGYAVRHFNDAGEQTGSTSLGASVPDLVTWETTFEADLNGDDRIGHSYNGVEDSDSGSSGAQAYGDHQIHTSTSGGFAITTAGFDQDDPQGEVPVGLSQVDRRGNALTISNANYTFLHAEENPSGGYQVLEQVVGRRGDIGYAVRHFNDAGEQTGSTSLGASVPDLVTWETTFEADLNGDDRIGHSYNGVEDSDSGSSGAQAYGDHQIHTSTSGGFAITTAGFDQDDPQGEVPVGLSQVDRRGNALTISNANYTFLHAEENPSGGYQVLEQVVGRRGDIGYAVRHFNDAGEQTGSTSLGASVPDLVTWETTFEADLNGDDRIGHSYNGVEDSDSGSSGAQAYGDHQIHTSTSGGFAITTAGFDQDDPQGEVPVGLSQVDRRGNALTISNANYTFLHAEENPSGGYQVLEQVVGRRGDIGYAVRHFNDAGEQTGSTSLGASVPDLVTWETTFEADLNGDDRIGHSYNGVEDSDSGSSGAQAYGDHQIHTSTSGGFAITTAGFDQDDPQGEVPVGLSQVDRRGNALTISNANYTFLHAEENPSGGYQVLEQVVGRRGDIGYAVRHFNDAGEQTGSTSLGASVPDLVTWETTFEADLNGDDRIGHSYNGVEDSDSGSSGAQAYGDHQIHTSTSGGFAITTAGFDQDDPQGEVPVGLSQVDRRGNALTISNANYTFLHAEENPSGGYQVLEQVVGRRGDIGYAVRHFNDAGEQTGSTSLGASVPDLVTWETTFEADLNGDDRIGHSYNGVEDSDSGSSGAQAYGDHQIHTSTSGGFAITTAGFDQDDPQGEVPVGLSQVDRRGNALTISNANYTFLHAEENPSGGYQVLEQVVGRRGDIGYAVRHFNDAGEQTGSTSLGASVPDLVTWETTFEADLNGDSIIGENAPTFATPDPVILPEDRTASSTPIATVMANATSGIASYAITSGNTGDVFAIDTSGAITQVAGLDFETTDAYELTIRATDTLGNTVSASLDLTITDQNDAPEFTGGETAAVDFAENSQAVVYTAQATDEDASADVITYALGSDGGDEGLFSIDPTSGELTFKTPPDFEDAQDVGGDNVYEVQIQASDGNGGTATQAAKISVTNVNELHSFTSGNSFNAAENQLDTGYTPTATDPENDTVTFTINGGADAEKFELVGGALRFKDAHIPDFENPTDSDANRIYEVQIDASDSEGRAVTQEVTVIVTDVINEHSPVFASGTTFNALENHSETGYTPAASDADGDTITFTINGGADANKFELDAVTGALKFRTAPDYESPADSDGDNVYEVQIEASDGNGGAATQALSITVDDLRSSGITFYGVYDRGDYWVSSAGDINNDGYDDIIIGDENADPVFSKAGQSYVVFGKPTGHAASVDLSSLTGNDGFIINGIGLGDLSGHSVSSAGDINNDSFDDIIIAAPSAGKSYLVFGRSTGHSSPLDLSDLNGTNGFVISGIDALEFAGPVSSAGDINGDTFDDILIGAPDSGRAYVVFGRPTGYAANLELSTLNSTDGFVINGDRGFRTGFSVSSAGDINNDGYDDIIVGATRALNSNGDKTGAAYVIFGKASGSYSASLDLSSLNGTNGFVIYGDHGFYRWAIGAAGESVSSAGDINGDGYDDIIIGDALAPGSGSNWNAGRAHVVFGKATGSYPATLELSSLTGNDGFVMYGENGGDHVGRSVSSAGDVNDDGYDDIIIGADFANPLYRGSAGTSYVVFGKPDGYLDSLELSSLATGNGTNGFEIYGAALWYRSGSSVSAAGDINGDGYDDIIIGNYLAVNVKEGAYVVFGQSEFDASVDLLSW